MFSYFDALYRDHSPDEVLSPCFRSLPFRKLPLSNATLPSKLGSKPPVRSTGLSFQLSTISWSCIDGVQSSLPREVLGADVL